MVNHFLNMRTNSSIKICGHTIKKYAIKSQRYWIHKKIHRWSISGLMVYDAEHHLGHYNMSDLRRSPEDIDFVKERIVLKMAKLPDEIKNFFRPKNMSLDHRIEYAILFGIRLPEYEERFLGMHDKRTVVHYIKYARKERWPAFEDYLDKELATSDTVLAYTYMFPDYHRVCPRPSTICKKDLIELDADGHHAFTVSINNIKVETIVTLEPNGTITHNIAKPGANLWFLIDNGSGYGRFSHIIYQNNKYYMASYDSDQRVGSVCTETGTPLTTGDGLLIKAAINHYLEKNK